MEDMHLHQSYPESIKRLRRAEDDLRSAIGTVEGGRPWLAPGSAGANA